MGRFPLLRNTVSEGSSNCWPRIYLTVAGFLQSYFFHVLLLSQFSLSLSLPQKKTHGVLTAFPQSVDQVLLNECKPKCTIPHRVIARSTKCMDGVSEQSLYLVSVVEC